MKRFPLYSQGYNRQSPNLSSKSKKLFGYGPPCLVLITLCRSQHIILLSLSIVDYQLNNIISGIVMDYTSTVPTTLFTYISCPV